ncbi:Endoribonuclease [Desulfonema magnum]|uniref:Endoribonuclease YbeY n=1 Tax=Desulfonema magnum TaxID=45655 RepID=A0A975GRN1_9BACT|nr:Endoribonuclease [Desulfonema magnum]
MACPDDELSILIVDDLRIAELNKEYLEREGPTNVIAFPMCDYFEAEDDIRKPERNIMPKLLGDVVISVDTARKEGEKAGITMEERFTQLLVHGILHLIGYDHEQTEAEALRMEMKTNELLKLIGGVPTDSLL